MEKEYILKMIENSMKDVKNLENMTFTFCLSTADTRQVIYLQGSTVLRRDTSIILDTNIK